MGREDKKTKRRGSQAFRFEQTEETLLQNEAICDLYKNKNYVAPEPKEWESILEEAAPVEPPRGRRADGAQAGRLGAKEKRFVEEYKYWRVDNKEKYKKRKNMIQKMWKGRKKLKQNPLTEEAEKYLEELIDQKDTTFEESDDGEEAAGDAPGCVWAAEGGLQPTASQSSVEEASCVWDGEARPGAGRKAREGRARREARRTREQKRVASRPEEVRSVAEPREEELDPLASLAGLIPAEELEEMLGSTDLLFCGEMSRRQEEPKGRRPSTGPSVRRSARLSSHPSSTGSIFTEEVKEVLEAVAVEEDGEVFKPASRGAGEAEENREVEGFGGAATPSGKDQGEVQLSRNRLVPLRISKAKSKSRIKPTAAVLRDISNISPVEAEARRKAEKPRQRKLPAGLGGEEAERSRRTRSGEGDRRSR
jgi:hypothetical protein